MILRIAKKSDYKILADVHLECGKAQINGFMHKLGKTFLQTYYKVFLNEKSAVILIAEDENGYCCGFHSGTMKAEEHLANMKRHKYSLALALIPGILRRPNLIHEVLLRNAYISSKKESTPFGIRNGARAEYWAWRPSVNKPTNAVALRMRWSNIMHELGCRSFRLEVDLANTNIEKYSRAFSCMVIEELTLPDGRKRIVMEQNLNKKRSK